jgi:hypothetical protein
MRRLVAVLISLSLAFGGLLFASPALAVDGEAKDFFAARVIAKATHNRVLVTGLLDEFSTTYLNPDGTLTIDSYGSAIRVRDDRTNSGWRDLDYDLVFNADGSVSPKSGLYSLFISGGGSAAIGLMSGLVMGLREAQDKHLKGGAFWGSVGTTVLIDTVAGAVGGALSKLPGKIIETALKREVATKGEKLLKFSLETAAAYLGTKSMADRGRIIRNRFGL